MKTCARILSLVAVLAAGALVPAEAIIIRHDRDEADYRELGQQYPAVGKISPDGTGTLIAPRWVLTAAHVAQMFARREGAVSFGGRSYPVDAAFMHPDWKRNGDVADIALLRLAGPVQGIEVVGLNKKRDEAGKQVIFVGYGDFGTGETGPVKMDGILRGATNRVDEVQERAFYFTFAAPADATRLEGISGPGDSGGPALAERDGKLWTLGVSSVGMEPEGQKPGTYGARERYTRVSTYAGWLRKTMRKNQSGGAAAQVSTRAGAPESVARDRAEAFLAAYNSDDPGTLASFVGEHLQPGGSATEQRVAGIRGLFGRQGRLDLIRMKVDGYRVLLVCQGPERRVELGFHLVQDAPFRSEGILVDDVEPAADKYS